MRKIVHNIIVAVFLSIIMVPVCMEVNRVHQKRQKEIERRENMSKELEEFSEIPKTN